MNGDAALLSSLCWSEIKESVYDVNNVCWRQSESLKNLGNHMIETVS